MAGGGADSTKLSGGSMKKELSKESPKAMAKGPLWSTKMMPPEGEESEW